MAEKTDKSLDELKKLSPADRVRMLRQLADAKKKEAEETQKLLQKSEDELKEHEILQEKIPIPQLTAEEILLSTVEEREIFKAHRQGRTSLEEPVRTPAQREKPDELEDTVTQTKAPNVITPRYGEILELSRLPMEYFQQRFQHFEQRVYTAGGISNLPDEERRRFFDLSRGWDTKVHAIESDRYEPTREAFKAAVLVERLRDKLQSMYQSKATGKEDIRIGWRPPSLEEQEPQYRS